MVHTGPAAAPGPLNVPRNALSRGIRQSPEFPAWRRAAIRTYPGNNQMTATTGSFTLLHAGEHIGTTRLESGDPEAGSVSGLFANVGGATALSRWLTSVGGAEDEGVFFIALNADFELLNSDGETLDFGEGTLIAVPDEGEAYVEFSGFSAADYGAHFSHHIAALTSGADTPVG